ncbi:MAG: imidazolonepropionase [Rhodospirillum sp.]|nr:imidazolonepropionase [Rhodospirillum sp.]MCF8488710.1 imidazolonepropionase [Rhodospirillum sp.]MCF8502165.1 imidazolonepropionase [Rhodospirillum sp.]
MSVTLYDGLRLLPLATASTAVVEGAVIVVQEDRIAYVGPRDALSGALDDRIAVTHDLGGRLVTPGLIDCHTHLVFGGDRSREFEMRLEGVSYEEISRAGGGIAATVAATRAASEDALVASALRRLDHLLAEGVTTVEVKSGYGLDLETERRMLRAARRLGEERGVRIRTTFLGAHALPPGETDRDAYIEAVLAMLPILAAEGLVDAVDGFCEGIAFSVAQMERVFTLATSLGLPVKLHAEQLSNLGGAAMAAGYGALSADHLEYLDEAGVAAMAKAGTVAVLLPGAFYMLRETKLPPLDALRRQGVPLALSTDCNPGTSPLTSLLLTMNMGATLFRMTVAECLAGVTLNAAKALGLGDDLGSVEPGKVCDLAVWDVDHPAELVSRIGFNPLHARLWKGLPQ